MKEQYDVIIVGTGVAGLACALSVSKELEVLLVTKETIEKSNSYLAQGGISVLRDDKDYDSYIQDTLKAGKYQNNLQAVVCMIKESKSIPEQLIEWGVEFDRDGGKLLYTREGAHSINRILHHKDTTGQEIMEKLIVAVKERKNIMIKEQCTMIDILNQNNRCQGIVVKHNQNLQPLWAKKVVLATGGIGGLFANSTNFRHITGDGIGIALKNGIRTKDLNYIQIHPTALYTEKEERRFLISEAVRGEGGILLNQEGKRFVDELLPRDIVSLAIQEEILKSKLPYVYLSVVHLGEERVKTRFPNIYKKCLEAGYDITKTKVPVAPAQHYFMGGIEIDLDGQTSLEGLFAIGETGCNGVHGANRLASNSLLESVVFAQRAATKIEKEIEEVKINSMKFDYNYYRENCKEEYKELILNEIKGRDEVFYDKWCNYAG